MKTWANDFFNKLYWNLFMYRTEEQIKKEANIILQLIPEKLKMKPEILDVCCGVGDIAQFLSSYGNVTGVEISKDYIDESKTIAKDVNIYHESALDFKPQKKFDVVYNWYSSFAYFSNEHNQELLKNCYNWTKKDGVFLIEIFNSYAVLKNFIEKKNYETQFEGKTFYTTRNSSIEWKNRHLRQIWNIEDKLDYNATYDTFTVLYFIDELISMLSLAGFKQTEVFGRNALGFIEKYNVDSSRLIIKAYK